MFLNKSKRFKFIQVMCILMKWRVSHSSILDYSFPSGFQFISNIFYMHWTCEWDLEGWGGGGSACSCSCSAVAAGNRAKSLWATKVA